MHGRTLVGKGGNERDVEGVYYHLSSKFRPHVAKIGNQERESYALGYRHRGVLSAYASREIYGRSKITMHEDDRVSAEDSATNVSINVIFRRRRKKNVSWVETKNIS